MRAEQIRKRCEELPKTPQANAGNLHPLQATEFTRRSIPPGLQGFGKLQDIVRFYEARKQRFYEARKQRCISKDPL